MPALTIHRGPYTLRGRTCARVEWRGTGELRLEVESDRGAGDIILSAKQVDRLVTYLLAPYVAGPAEDSIP